MALDLSKHPCFDSKARHEFGRVHLPVAPKCNIQCNYCDRQYDCCNESRPGVTSIVLSPKQALEYYKQIRREFPIWPSWESPAREIRSPTPRRRWKRSR